MTPKYSLLLLFLSFILYLSSGITFAQHFESASYIIDWGNFNITSGRKTSTNYFLTDTVGQNAPGAYQSEGFTVKSGFQYIYETMNKLTFVIDNLDINFGTLAAGVASTAVNTITITTPSGRGYQIMAQYNHPLSLLSGTTIPDTTCDSGTCTPDTSAVWGLISAYGFGFNAIGVNSSGTITGIGTSSYFADSTYFRPFSGTGRIIMSEEAPVKDRSARISYKANVSSVQSAGQYQNAIIFTAVPKY